MREIIFLITLITACLAPVIGGNGKAAETFGKSFGGFPSSLNGEKLIPISLSPEEVRYHKNFPGEIARFNDGNQEILIRWVDKLTRQLHPASDCYKGSGYVVSNFHMRRDSNNHLWSCFKALNQNNQATICERIYDEHGNSWGDSSSWYWAVLLGKSKGPWWSETTQTMQSDG